MPYTIRPPASWNMALDPRYLPVFREQAEVTNIIKESQSKLSEKLKNGIGISVDLVILQ